ncbi:MAG: quinolinate synthase [Bacteroidales bacterium]|jgi:quinolinate synthase|nr:quinolinate synthase [Anaerophaga sp.]MDK2908722.1 quinolinate synthase [Bacteroidales bacterium]MDN5328349.1 quinolinate synthase [Bacteroidales bacterium]
MNNNKELIEGILELKRQKHVVILAHYYQIPEIQDLADFIGDSLALSQRAKNIESPLIAFCGVHFMAETAKILNPDKKVIVPDLDAGCSLADSCPPDRFEEFLREYPQHTVITYINSTARIKALSDIICTSGNAVQIVESLPRDEKIVFAPDKNLGGYINRITGREMVLWDGVCQVHDLLTAEAVLKLKMQNSDALLVAHPECNRAVLEIADYIGSTNGMIKFVGQHKGKKFIVASETGIVHQMKKIAPENEFLVAPANETCSCNDCPYMKMNTLDKLYKALLTESPEIKVDEDLAEKARKPIDRMLEISKKAGLI